MELIIENIRCFAGKHTIPIKPITLLTGENSSGKSTLLACLSVINDFSFPLQPRLNEPPFSLGNFDTIATHKSGRGEKAATFSLGYRRTSTGEKSLITALTEMVATYTGSGRVVELLRLACSGGAINVYGGLLKTEYFRNQDVFGKLAELDRAGRTRKISDDKVDRETELVTSLNLCESNDTHIIALARVGNVRLLCSGDKTLYKDFHNKDLVDNPRGKVYLNPTHRHLINQFCK